MASEVEEDSVEETEVVSGKTEEVTEMASEAEEDSEAETVADLAVTACSEAAEETEVASAADIEVIFESVP